MKRLFAGLLLTIAVLAAQDRRMGPADNGRRMALVIGNASYSSLTRLVNPLNDARAVASTLKSIGFANQDVRLVIDAPEAEMRRSVRAFVESVKRGDLAFVYYAGHGVEVKGNNYLLPVDIPGDASEGFVQDEAVSAQRLLRDLDDQGARVRVLILDACRDNPLRASRSAGGGLAPMEGRGSLVVFSTEAGRTAKDNPGESNSVFTQYLVQGLRQPGVSLDDAMKRVSRNVARATEERQVPAIYGLLLDDLILVPGTAPDRAPAPASIPVPPISSPAPLSNASPANSTSMNSTALRGPRGVGWLEGDVIGVNGQPLAGATIVIERQDVAATYRVKTDKKGHYLYAGLPSPVLYQATAEGESKVVVTVTGETTTANFDRRTPSLPAELAPSGRASASDSNGKPLDARIMLAANAMPEDSYAFRPTPHAPAFAGLLASVAEGCARVPFARQLPSAKVELIPILDRVMPSCKATADVVSEVFGELLVYLQLKGMDPPITSGWENSIRQVANAMPESGYGFRPAAGAPAFGELVAQIVNVSGSKCSRATHVKVGATKQELGMALSEAMSNCDHGRQSSPSVLFGQMRVYLWARGIDAP